MTYLRTFVCVLCIAVSSTSLLSADQIDFSQAVVVHSPQQDAVEHTATRVLLEETSRRSGIVWKTDDSIPATGTAIVVTTRDGLAQFGEARPAPHTAEAGHKPEGFRITISNDNRVVWIIGADGPGTLYGVGQFLRLMNASTKSVRFPADVDLQTSPEYPIRGHQLGYRNTANSYDAWDVAQYEQYIRELSFFGTNAIENIPMSPRVPLMPIEPSDMHREMASICQRYGMQYWIWMPATVDLEDAESRRELLDTFETIFKGTPHLTGVFVPGGDPGDHIPRLMLPFLKDASERLAKHHPAARMWMSMQGFSHSKAQAVYDLLQSESPEWLGGIVAGPSSRPIPELRNHVPDRYPIRLYPDLTHNKICQYPVPWWDMAYGLTLGREAINPRPVQYQKIHNWFAPYTDGFVSYSDGCHDDLNKAVWSGLGWDSRSDLRQLVREYARVFFGEDVAEQAAEGIFALEQNWQGPLQHNATVEGTLKHWQTLAESAPKLADNWRWQMNLLRANYDAFVRRRLLHETSLEASANQILRTAGRIGPNAAVAQAQEILNQATTNQAAPQLRSTIIKLCEALNQSIGLQTSVDKYGAANPERGAVLDFIDIPLNNRWWLKDEFKKVSRLDSDDTKIERLLTIANWESPGHGSYYDDIGHPAKSSHVRHSVETTTIHGEEAIPEPLLWWMGNVGGESRLRLSSQSSMDYPEAVIYEGLDPNAEYVVRCGGLGQFHLRIDGEPLDVRHERAELGETRDFPVPARFIADRRIELTWDRPQGEGHLNWRQRSRLCEVWLLKQ